MFYLNEDLVVLVAGTPCDTENVSPGHEVQPDTPVTMRHSSNLDRIVHVPRVISAHEIRGFGTS